MSNDWQIEQQEAEFEESQKDALAEDAACRIVLNGSTRPDAIAGALNHGQDVQQACESCIDMEGSDDSFEAYMQTSLPYDRSKATQKQNQQIYRVKEDILINL